MLNKARSAVIWSGLDIFLRQGMSFAVSVVLARLLAPEDFGVVALLAVFLGLAGVFIETGFSQALIQRQGVTHTDESTVFWFNFVVALLMMLVLFAIAPWIAEFFDLPVLAPLTRVMSGILVVGALGSIHGTLLTKCLDFKTQMKLGAVSALTSGCVGIYMAWDGYGVWSLAVQIITDSVVTTSLLWMMSPWRPMLVFSWISFKRLFSFGGWIFGAGLLNILNQQGYKLLIGKFYSAQDLGFYNRAENTQQLPSSIFTGILTRVALPLYSSINTDKARLRRGVRLSVRSIMLVTTPVSVGLAVVSDGFIGVVFGEQWLFAVPILQVLCIRGVLFPLQTINLNVLQAQGFSNLFFRMGLIKNVVGISLLVMGSFYGIMGIAWSRVIQSVLGLLINTYYTKKYLDYGIKLQLLDCCSSVAISFGMGLFVSNVSSNYHMLGVVGLLEQVGCGIVFYILFNIIFGVSAFREGIGFFKRDVKI